MKFERSELGALFSKLRTAVPEVRAVGPNERIFSVEFGEYIAYGVGHIGFYAKIAGKNSCDYKPCCLRALLYIGKVVGNMSDTPYLMKEAGEEQKK